MAANLNLIEFPWVPRDVWDREYAGKSPFPIFIREEQDIQIETNFGVNGTSMSANSYRWDILANGASDIIRFRLTNRGVYDADGWIHREVWDPSNRGLPPYPVFVNENTKIEVILRESRNEEDYIGKAHVWDWSNFGTNGDIVKFKILSSNKIFDPKIVTSRILKDCFNLTPETAPQTYTKILSILEGTQ